MEQCVSTRGVFCVAAYLLWFTVWFRRPICRRGTSHSLLRFFVSGAGIAMEPDNEDELIAAVLHLADDSERRRRLGEAGYNYFTRRNDRDAQALDYGSIMAMVRRTREDPMSVRV